MPRAQNSAGKGSILLWRRLNFPIFLLFIYDVAQLFFTRHFSLMQLDIHWKAKGFSSPGAACIVFDEDGCFCFAKRISWDRDMISVGVDNSGVRFGDKSTFLEFVAVLLPFLLIPKLLKNQHLVFHVHNLNCIFGWESRVTERWQFSFYHNKSHSSDFFLFRVHCPFSSCSQGFELGNPHGWQSVPRVIHEICWQKSS